MPTNTLPLRSWSPRPVGEGPAWNLASTSATDRSPEAPRGPRIIAPFSGLASLTASPRPAPAQSPNLSPAAEYRRDRAVTTAPDGRAPLLDPVIAANGRRYPSADCARASYPDVLARQELELLESTPTPRRALRELLRDPIFYSTFRDPVVASDGCTYDLGALMLMRLGLGASGAAPVLRSPLSNLPLESTVVFRNTAIGRQVGGPEGVTAGRADVDLEALFLSLPSHEPGFLEALAREMTRAHARGEDAMRPFFATIQAHDPRSEALRSATDAILDDAHLARWAVMVPGLITPTWSPSNSSPSSSSSDTEASLGPRRRLFGRSASPRAQGSRAPDAPRSEGRRRTSIGHRIADLVLREGPTHRAELASLIASGVHPAPELWEAARRAENVTPTATRAPGAR